MTQDDDEEMIDIATGVASAAVTADRGGQNYNTTQVNKARDVTINNTVITGGPDGIVERVWLQKEDTGQGAPVATAAPGDRLHLRFKLTMAGLARRLGWEPDGAVEALFGLYLGDPAQPFDLQLVEILWDGKLEPKDRLIVDKAPIPVQMPMNLTSGEARLCVALHNQRDVAAFLDARPVTLQGNWFPPKPLKVLLLVDSAERLPDDAACLHIYPFVPPAPAAGAQPMVNLSCVLGKGTRIEEREQTLVNLPACVLPDEKAAGLFIAGVNEISKQRKALLDVLKQGYDGVMVFDFAGTGAPWEGLLDLEKRMYLSATLPTSRWLRLSNGRAVKLRPDQPLGGPVLALGELPGAPAGWQVTKVANAMDLWSAFFAPAGEPYSLVYVGDVPDAAELETELGIANLGGELPGPRPLFILGYPEAAAVTYTNRVAGGLTAMLLRDVADGVIGLGGRGDQPTLERLIRAIVGQLAAGAAVGEAVRQARSEIITAWVKPEKPELRPTRLALATALLLRYYGSPLLAVAPEQAAGGGGG